MVETNIRFPCTELNKTKKIVSIAKTILLVFPLETNESIFFLLLHNSYIN